MADKKSEQQSVLPVSGKMFYIDEVDIPKGKLKKLERCLSLLGAKLEKFFTKDIFCLITDHGQPGDYKSRSKSADEASASTPSPFAVTPGSNAGPPSETSGSNTKAPSSRAALMLNKSHKQNSRVNSVSSASPSEQLVRNARQWSIKMVMTDVALQWMEQKIVTLGLIKKRKKPTERSERAPRFGGKRLKAPFLKIEDKSLKYRPIFRQLTKDTVPVLNTEAEHSPFENKAAIPMLPRASAAITASPPDVASDTVADTTLNTSKLEGKGKQLKGKGKAAMGNQPKQPQKKLTFCAVCQVRFEDLDQHLRSDQHKKFAEDDTNYAQVDALLNTNACMKRFLNDILKYHTVHQQEGLAQQEMLLEDSPTHDLVPASTSAQPKPIDVPLNPSLLLHRSVSDSNCTGDSLTMLPLAEDDSSMSVQRVDATFTELNDHSTDLQTSTTDDSTDNSTLAAAIDDSAPNISKVVVKKLEDGGKASSATKGSPNLVRTVDNIECVEIETASLSSSHISASELVKLRRRGANKSTPKPKTPTKKKSPTKRKTKKKKQQKDNLADVQAHWALLIGKKFETSKDASVLPMDVSYGALDESQLENMANQRASIGTQDEDDRSLVQSIHSLLNDVNLNSSVDDDVSQDTEDPLLSCDSYITQKLSRAQQNNMLKPTTPRKPPRVSLGARDLADEHFSPQKQRLSISIEKERRHSETENNRLRMKISKLNFELPISESPTCPSEDKENISTANSSHVEVDLSHVEKDGSPVITEANVSVANTDDSANKRKVLGSPNTASEEKRAQPMPISTPAVDLNSKPSPDVISSTPVTSSFKKPLFDTPAPAGKVLDKTKSTSSSRHCRRYKRYRNKTVTYRCESVASVYSDCFGFEDNCLNNSTPNKHANVSRALVKQANIVNTARQNSITSPPRNSITSPRHSKVDYERQNSLLSFGSVSLSQYDDVFGQLPEEHGHALDSLVNSSENCTPKARHMNDYFGFSDSDLSAPGFRVSSKERKKAEHARRTLNAGATPRQKKVVKPDQCSPSASRQSARLRGNSPILQDTANANNNNNKRMRSPKQDNFPKKSRQNNTPVLCQSELSQSPENANDDISITKTPSVQSINCSTNAPAVEERLNSVEIQDRTEAKERVTSPTPSYRSLPDSARDYLVKHKYDYTVPSSASKTSPQKRRTRHTRELNS